MRSASVVETSRYYLGSVTQSMEHLPRWYQLFALASVSLSLFLRDVELMRWIIKNLHSSLGTDWVWYPQYQRLLEQMSFGERMGFTLYGVGLALAATLIYKVFCQETYGLGTAASQLFQDQKAPLIASVIAFGGAQMVCLRHHIAACISRPSSLANAALNGFRASNSTTFDPALVMDNAHFIIQMELLKELVHVYFTTAVPLALIAGAFRLWRDLPRRTHVSLRWYVATMAMAYLTIAIPSACAWEMWRGPDVLAGVAWCLFFVGLVNFTFGPSKRAGVVVTSTVINGATEALRAFSTSCALWLVVLLAVLTVIVSVHVVELILLWLLIALLCVWVPATIDACSTDYITMLSSGVGVMAYHRSSATRRACVRAAGLLAMWWLAISLVYNIIAQTTRSRYPAIGTILWLLVWQLASLFDRIAAEPVPNDTPESVMLQKETSPLSPETVDWPRIPALVNDGVMAHLGAQVERFLTLAEMRNEQDTETFMYLLQMAGILCVVVVVLNGILSNYQSATWKELMRRRHMPLVSPHVMYRKVVRTIVLVICLSSFGITWVAVEHYILPHISGLLPERVNSVVGGAVACTVLGNVMDVKETIYEYFLRMLGTHDPPKGDDDTSEDLDDEVELS